VYDDAHLARLRLIRLMLRRGYTFATIGELIDAWSAGQGIAELIGLDDALAEPWSDETPEVLDGADLSASFGMFTAEDLHRAAGLGLIEIEGDQVVVPSPRLLEAGAQLALAGVPVPVVIDLAGELRARLDVVARLLFKIFADHVAHDGRPAAEVADSLMRLRPFARQTVEALLSMALDREAERLLAHRAARARSPNTEHVP